MSLANCAPVITPRSHCVLDIIRGRAHRGLLTATVEGEHEAISELFNAGLIRATSSGIVPVAHGGFVVAAIRCPKCEREVLTDLCCGEVIR